MTSAFGIPLGHREHEGVVHRADSRARIRQLAGMRRERDVMLAIEVARPGGPDVLRPIERPEPTPAAGEVLVRNHWIGVNYVDLQHRAGAPYPVDLPMVLGIEAAGMVEATGSDVDPDLAGARIGDPVVHQGLGGRYAELTVVPAEQLIPLPSDVPLDVAAAVMMNGTTAHVLTRMAMEVGPKDSVVVHAAAGGTGGAVVQLAAAAGAQVIGFASTIEKARAAVDLGAHHAFAMATTPDPVAAVLSVADGGASVVYDGNGRDTLEASVDMLDRFGTLVLYGQSSGPYELFDPGRLSGITGVGRGTGSLTVRWVAASHYLLERAERIHAMTAVLDDVRAERLDPRIAQRIPLREASRAHAILASRSVQGKLLLDARH